MSYIQVESGDFDIGVPLRRSLYNKDGILLIKEGGILGSEQHRDILFENGVFCYDEPGEEQWISPLEQESDDEGNPFAQLDNAKIKLKRAFDLFRKNNAHEEFLPRIRGVALLLQLACDEDQDAALANLHLDYDTPYDVLHHLQAAVLCEIIGKHLKVSEKSRFQLVNAGLTHDISLLDIQHVLDRQILPLSDKELERIRDHPKDSAQLLRGLGVTDKSWLDAVEHHHERLDGSGYSDSLAGDGIRVSTQILAIADIYSAMIRDRPQRKAILSKEAMRSLLMEHAGQHDARLTQILIKELGVFPPGLIVRLATGEITVVKQREGSGATPIVYAFIDPDGMPMTTPERRETASPGNRIKSILPFSRVRSCFPIIRSLWMHSAVQV